MEGVIAKSASVWQQKIGEAKMTKDELKLAFQKAFQMGQDYWYYADHEFESYNKKSDAIRAKFNEMVKETIEEALAQPEQEPVAWKYDVTYNQDGTVSVALPDGDELRIVLPNQQEPYCWTWDVWVSGGKWRAEYGWEKPTEKVVNLQPLYTAPPQRKPLTLGQKQRLWSSVGDKPTLKDRVNAYGLAIEAAHGIKGEA